MATRGSPWGHKTVRRLGFIGLGEDVDSYDESGELRLAGGPVPRRVFARLFVLKYLK